MEIKIGRNVSGTMDLLVPVTCKSVSKEHAKIVYENQEYLIYDLDSKNGTYVNGRRILKKSLNLDDVVILGGQGGEFTYKLDLYKIKKDFEKIDLETKTDFKKEFQVLKKVYKDYHEEVSKLKKSVQIKSQVPKIAISIIIGIILILSIVFNLIPPNFQKFQYPVMMIIMAGVGVLSFSNKSSDLVELQTELEIKYQKKYVCPKCKKKYNLNTHWRKIESEGSCPHKCGAIFK